MIPLLSALLVASLALPAGAVDYYWNVVNPATGFVSEAANWSLVDGSAGAVPAAGDVAWLRNDGVAHIDADHVFAGSLSDIYVGDGDTTNPLFPPSAGHVVQTGGTLNHTLRVIIGNNGAPGTSTFNVEGGTIAQTGTTGGGEFTVGRGSTATMTMSGNATLSRLNVGNSYTYIGRNAMGNGTLTMYNTSALNLGAHMRIGNTGGATGAVTMNDSSRITIGGHATADRNRLYMGWEGTGTLTMNDTASLSVGQNTFVGYGTATANGNATFEMRHNSTASLAGLWVGYGVNNPSWDQSYYGVGTLNLYDSATIAVNVNLRAGTWNYSQGAINLYDNSTVTVKEAVEIGESSSNNGGYLNPGPGGVGVLTVNDNATLTATGEVRVGRYEYAHGTMTIASTTGTATVNANGGVCVGSQSAEGTLNLRSGGVLNTTYVTMGTTAPTLLGSNLATLNLDGGILRAKGTQYNFIADGSGGVVTGHAYVQSGGAIIDSNNADITVKVALEADVTSPGGGLTKEGLGTLVLASGLDTYTGTTNVNKGSLFAFSNPGYSLGAISVKQGAAIGSAQWDSSADTIETNPLAGEANLAASSLSFENGASMTAVILGDLSAPFSANRITVGSLTAAGGTATVGVDLAGAALTGSGNYTLVNYSTTSGVTFLPRLDVLGTIGVNVTDNGLGTVSLAFAPIDNYWTSGGANNNYTTTGNWSSYVPNGTNRRALFDGVGETVNLNANVTLSSLTFNSGGFDLAPVSAYKLTMDSTIALSAHINNIGGSNTISAPIDLSKNTRITVVDDPGTVDVVESLTISGTIGGTGGIEKAGAGTLVVSSFADGAAGDLVLGGGVFSYIGATGSTGRGLAIMAASTVNVDSAAATLTLNGNLSGAGGSLTKTGAGTIEVRSPSASSAVVSSLTITGGGLAIDGLSGTTQLDVTGGFSMATSSASAMPTSGRLTLSGDTVLNVAGYSAIGTYGGTASLTMNDNAMYKGTSGRVGGMYRNLLTSDYNTVAIEMNGNAAIEFTSFFNIGETYSNVTATLNGASSITAGSIDFGWGDETNSIGVLNGTSSLTTTGTGILSVGRTGANAKGS
ncbi:MAG TPA: hypothetical protein DD670_07530, partial [Planctomycetaceae bacterium]|nr:hypothetical protein [Planctomycetaceae bacterium]